MGIQSKIEEIRSKPEHIRMRYTLISVFVSMLAISVLWIFSITTSFQSQKENAFVPMEATNQSKDAPDTKTDQSNPDAAPSLNEWIKK